MEQDQLLIVAVFTSLAFGYLIALLTDKVKMAGLRANLSGQAALKPVDSDINMITRKDILASCKQNKVAETRWLYTEGTRHVPGVYQGRIVGTCDTPSVLWVSFRKGFQRAQLLAVHKEFCDNLNSPTVTLRATGTRQHFSGLFWVVSYLNAQGDPCTDEENTALWNDVHEAFHSWVLRNNQLALDEIEVTSNWRAMSPALRDLKVAMGDFHPEKVESEVQP